MGIRYIIMVLLLDKKEIILSYLRQELKGLIIHVKYR